MVNYGVSRACDMCKKRRKKCDETRPACTRCIKSRRQCPGYKDEATLTFRHYEPLKAAYQSPVCWWSTEIADEQLEERALSIFVAEFVVEAGDRQHSRGFLDGMQILLSTVHPQSTLASAARILVLASIANRTGRDSLVRRTQRQYGKLLKRYHESLSETRGASVECLFTAVLLGIYEIIVSSETAPTQHVAHVRGVSAFIRGGVIPVESEKGVEFSPLGNPLLLKSPVGAHSGRGVLCAPISHSCLRTLDSTLIKFSLIFDRAEALLVQAAPSEQELLQLESDALDLEEEFREWGDFGCNDWAPKVYGTVGETAARASRCLYYCAGPVDIYFDYYVAAVWNIWRKTQLLHIDCLAKIARLLSREDRIPSYEERAAALAAQMKASIPYHLAFDLDEYLRLANAGAPFILPNRPVGGLLLLHPLYAAARCTVLPMSDRIYFIDCLEWIGRHMGIGQAKLVADLLRSDMHQFDVMQTPQLPFMDMGEGHVLVWAGMMLQPTSCDVQHLR